jgi:hypothetical protein
VPFRGGTPGAGLSLGLIDRGARLYQNFPLLVFRAAVLEAYAGNRDEAKWLVARGLERDLMPGERLRFERLRATLGRAETLVEP